jgi:hypothetical protein
VFDLEKYVKDLKIVVNLKTPLLNHKTRNEKFLNDEFFYIGQVKNQKFHGIGRICYFNDGMYEGEFKDGLQDGYGRFIYNQHAYYEGQWSKGKRHGFGTNYYYSGYEEEAKWENDKLIKIVAKRKTPVSIITTRRDQMP